jgi:CBS domain-containing protein
MIVRELMSTPAQTCRPDSDLAAVAGIMWHRDCGFVPVVDEAGHVAGIITDRDVCIAAGTRRELAERIAAHHVMSRSVHACLPGDSIDDALAAMKEFRVRRLPVIDGNGHLQGVISLSDIVRAVGKRGGPTATSLAATLGAICAPRRPVTAVA